MERSDTIAAISTPPGSGGIGIIRISGPGALSCLQTVFVPLDQDCLYTSHRLYYGRIVHPDSRNILDEVLAVYMAAPKTYTREDVVEIHCHGNFLILQAILELLLEGGLRLAAPGEFTKLAYLNGRIDLTQAEAVIDILSAKTRKGMDMALAQLGGSLYRQVDKIRTVLVEMRAVVEVAIDFPDEDIDIVHHAELRERLLAEVLAPLDRLLRQAEQGRIFRDGISVVIVGLPNVGKSSLLNTLLQEDRALVTAIPGTTRDTIEEYIDLRGVPMRVVDTAGIRHDAGEVERLGIERARKQIDQADVVLFVIDGSRGVVPEERDLLGTVSHKPLLLVSNKGDLSQKGAALSTLGPAMSRVPCVTISAKEEHGIEELKDSLLEMVLGGKDQWQEEGCAPNVRHKAALVEARTAVVRVSDGLLATISSDLLAIDLKESLDQLNDIVGVTTTEDVLDVIFEQFCLGK